MSNFFSLSISRMFSVNFKPSNYGIFISVNINPFLHCLHDNVLIYLKHDSPLANMTWGIFYFFINFSYLFKILGLSSANYTSLQSCSNDPATCLKSSALVILILLDILGPLTLKIGMYKLNSLPTPNSLLYLMKAFICLHSCTQMDRPRPVPSQFSSDWSVWWSSKMCGLVSGGMPLPLSVTSIFR